jgi:hypothetical protein
MVDLHENGAGFRRASATEDRARSFHPTSTQIGGDPNVGAQAQTNLAPRGARSQRELLDKSWGYLSREGQTMGAFEITQGLLGRDAVISVRLDRVAKSDQRGLRCEGQARRIGASLLTQKTRDRIRRPRRRAIHGVGRSDGRRRGGGRRRRSIPIRACQLWRERRGRGRRRSGGRICYRRRSEKRGGMTPPLQNERVDAYADENARQGRAEIDACRDSLQTPGQPSS